ncbi:hypothetical protein RJ55_07438 [Drechmeria coniospora]|nr:hypothetical protein RJ55_07438 [Drechmeria coniospora]
MKLTSPTKEPEVSWTLQDRLKNIWPNLPNESFNEAPLAISWEVTRISQHCGVNLAGCDLVYNPNWRDQTTMREGLATCGPFLGKVLPQIVDTQLWMAALGTFELHPQIVTISAKLEYNASHDGPLFITRLHPLKLEFGHRLSRRFGADRFLEILVPSLATKERPASAKHGSNIDIINWLATTSHFMLGRNWRLYYMTKKKKTVQLASKSKTVYLDRLHFFAVDGITFRPSNTSGGPPPPEEAFSPNRRTKMKLGALLDWTIHISNNLSQPVPKLFSRIALSLTRTTPTVELQKHEIIHESKDIIVDSIVMNDGIGRMSKSLAKRIADHLKLENTPAAYQARIGSAKGMWIINTDDDGFSDDFWISTYPSQRKWDCDFDDPLHRTFEVKDWPRRPRPAALNQQFIPVLEERASDPAAMRQAIAEHLRSSLLADMDAFKEALVHPENLRHWLDQSRQSRQDHISHGHVPYSGGLPTSPEYALICLLDAGFDLQKNKYMQDRCQDIADRISKRLSDKTHIKIPQSTNLFMVPDFCSVLEEGEVHVAFSTMYQTDGFSDTLLEGMDILVGRSPAHFESDIQKARAVSHPKLRQLKDVIVFPMKGKSCLADMLSGGDYDGDRAWICWDRKIVDNFCNAPVPNCDDLFQQGYLTKLDLPVQDFCDEKWDIDMVCDKFVSNGVQFNMQPFLLGICTNCKEKLSYYENTVSGPKIVAYSNLLKHLVDQSKQGIWFPSTT